MHLLQNFQSTWSPDYCLIRQYIYNHSLPISILIIDSAEITSHGFGYRLIMIFNNIYINFIIIKIYIFLLNTILGKLTSLVNIITSPCHNGVVELESSECADGGRHTYDVG